MASNEQPIDVSATLATKTTTNDSEDDQIITPWKVTSKSGIDYMKLIERFGCDPITGDLIERLERVTKMKAHPWIRRGIFFSQKDLSNVLDVHEKGGEIYLYTGRGPSSEAMHLGHMIPFMFTKYLQDAFDAVVVIQMSDDEKYHFKGQDEGKPLEEYNRLTYENAKDIIACKFNPAKTLIFSNLTTVGGQLYRNVVKLMTTTGNQIRGIYGLTLDNTVGQLSWPCFQCAPAYSSSFPQIFHADSKDYIVTPDRTRTYVGKQKLCLVPMAIDQDPYFRMARDFAAKFAREGFVKPATIHTKFLVGLGGINAKMSSTGGEPVIFMTDEIKSVTKKIMSAFSGGQETAELQRVLGANLEVDVAYQYLLYFLDDDNELKRLAGEYKSGKILSGELKKILARLVCDFVLNHQANRSRISEEMLFNFFDSNKKFDHSRTVRDPVKPETTETYASYGVNFDPYFGLV